MVRVGKDYAVYNSSSAQKSQIRFKREKHACVKDYTVIGPNVTDVQSADVKNYPAISAELKTWLKSIPLQEFDINKLHLILDDYMTDQYCLAHGTLIHAQDHISLRGFPQKEQVTGTPFRMVWKITDNIYFISFNTSGEEHRDGAAYLGYVGDEVNYDEILDLYKDIATFSKEQRDTSCDTYKMSSFKELILDEKLMEDVKSEIEDFMGARQEYDKLGLPWKRGIALIGPPGNGKTFLIRALSKEYDLNVINVHHCIDNRGDIYFDHLYYSRG